MIDQLPHGSGGGQCSPFRGALTACHPRPRIGQQPRSSIAGMDRCRPALSRVPNFTVTVTTRHGNTSLESPLAFVDIHRHSLTFVDIVSAHSSHHFNRQHLPPFICILLSRCAETWRDKLVATMVAEKWRLVMNVIDAERRARELVDRSFAEHATKRRQICEWPVIGGSYVPGYDETKEMRRLAVQALVARDWFFVNGPHDVQPLPCGYVEREDARSGQGLLRYIVALYARSLEGRKYDIGEHPSFAGYVAGVLWEVEQPGSRGLLPHYPDELPQLLKRFPPRRLAGLGPGFCWMPPEKNKRTVETSRKSRARRNL